MFTDHIHENSLNDAQNLRLKHHLSKFNNSPNFHKYSTTTTFIINSPIGVIITPIHQHIPRHHQQQLITNSFKIQQTTTSLFILFSQKHNTPTYMIFGIWIHYQEQLIIQFTCTIIASTSKHEFIHLNSNNHLIT